MELRKGYKQTEIGVIPDDWEIRKLGDLGEISTGSTPPTSDSSNYGNDYLFVSPADLGKGKWIVDSEKKLSSKGFSISRAFPKGSILFTCIGSTIGKSGIASMKLTSNQQINAIYPSIAYSTECVYYALQIIANKIRSQAGEQAVPMVSKSLFSHFQIPFPSLIEQKAIAKALSDVDALIESLEQLIEKKRHIKQGAMQELLRPKDTWIKVLLGDITHVQTGSKNNQDKSENGKYPFFVRSATIERINNFSYSCEAILVPGEGNIGNIFHYIKGRFDVHQRVYAITNFDTSIYAKYIYYYMKKYFGMHALKNSVKATVDSLRLPTFLEFEIYIPSFNEQKAIATILSDLDSEIEALETKLEKTKQIKEGMMQELLTGRIRLV